MQHNLLTSLLIDDCPRCGTADPLEIVYGFPSGEMFDAADAGRIALGGCTSEDVQAAFRCRRESCRTEWGIIGRDEFMQPWTLDSVMIPGT